MIWACHVQTRRWDFMDLIYHRVLREVSSRCWLRRLIVVGWVSWVMVGLTIVLVITLSIHVIIAIMMIVALNILIILMFWKTLVSIVNLVIERCDCRLECLSNTIWVMKILLWRVSQVLVAVMVSSLFIRINRFVTNLRLDNKFGGYRRLNLRQVILNFIFITYWRLNNRIRSYCRLNLNLRLFVLNLILGLNIVILKVLLILNRGLVLWWNLFALCALALIIAR